MGEAQPTDFTSCFSSLALLDVKGESDRPNHVYVPLAYTFIHAGEEYNQQTSEGNFLPYRNISLEVLGRLSPLKTRIPDPKETEEDEEASADGYQKQGRRSRKPSFTPKETIYRNITAILDGFKIQQKQNGH